jgi:hypothetical protein
MVQWLGRALPIEDKAFRPYNKFPVVCLYWRLAYVVIPRGIEVLVSQGTGEVWRVRVNAPPDCTCSEFLTWFVPAFLLEAQKRNHIVESLDHLGCY